MLSSYLWCMKNLLLAIGLVAVTLSNAQTPVAGRPKLVIGIVVDQMRPDYVVRFWNKFGNNGFKRIMKEGFNCRNTHYNYAPTYTGPGHASVYTGTTPAYHGIAGNDWYDAAAADTVYCTADTGVRSVGGTGWEGMMSPSRLRTTTITDQLQLCTQMKSKVVGIALKDRGAILPVGRSGDAAYWYEGKSGNWITSTWYRNDLPKWVNEFNERRWPEEYLSKPWKTLLPIETYTESDPDNTPYEAPFSGAVSPVFPHNLPDLRGTSYDLLRKTPFGNTFTKDFALAAIQGEQLGADSITDFLALSFSSPDYIGHQFGPNSIEVEDNYIRLDRDLADLLNFLDSRVGKGKYLLFITADHACMENPKHMMEHKLYAGFTNPTAIADSIKGFLRNEYGTDSYFRCFINDQVYLNEEKIQTDKRDICEVEQKIARYALDHVTGIFETLTSCHLETEEYRELYRSRIQKGHFHGRSGNIWLVYAPGWTDRLYGSDGTRGTTHGSPFPYDAHVPLYWFGWNIPAGNSADEIQITDIAPTLSLLLNITLPNGCIGKKIDALVR